MFWDINITEENNTLRKLQDLASYERLDNCPFKTQAELDNYLKKRIYYSKWMGYNVVKKKWDNVRHSSQIQEDYSIFAAAKLIEEKVITEKQLELLDKNFDTVKNMLKNELQDDEIAEKFVHTFGNVDFHKDTFEQYYYRAVRLLKSSVKIMDNKHDEMFINYISTRKKEIFKLVEDSLDEAIDKMPAGLDKNLANLANSPFPEIFAKNIQEKDYRYMVAIIANRNSSTALLRQAETLVKNLTGKNQLIMAEMLYAHKNYKEVNVEAIFIEMGIVQDRKQA